MNDTPEDARRLVKLLDGVKAKVNLLPLNEAPGIPFRRPSDERVNAFAKILADRGVLVSVRKSRGRDIRAACGQLIVESERRTAGQQLAARWKDDAPEVWIGAWRPFSVRFAASSTFSASFFL